MIDHDADIVLRKSNLNFDPYTELQVNASLCASVGLCTYL